MKKFLHGLLDFFLIVLGIFSAALGLKGFLLSSHFIDGGVTGVSMLLSTVARLAAFNSHTDYQSSLHRARTSANRQGVRNQKHARDRRIGARARLRQVS